MIKKELNGFKGYCPECDSFVDGVLKKRKISTIVKGVSLNVEIKELFCKECGELITSEEIERMNDIAIYDAYKTKMNLLTSVEIKEIRQKREMSQSQMAEFLDIGEKDITRYENGAIQTKSIDNMIRMVGDDSSFLRMCVLFNKTDYLKRCLMELIKNKCSYQGENEKYQGLFYRPTYSDNYLERKSGEFYGKKELRA